MPETISPGALAIPDAAAYLGVSEGTIFNLIRSNRLAKVKIGRRTVIARSELDRFISAN